MKIAIMGSGGVGGYFGARLAEAGDDVAFIARGAHLEAIRRDGLRVLSPLGDVHIRPAAATDDPAEIGPVDVVLFAVKLWDTEAAAAAVRPLLGPATGAPTAVISLQNGVEAEDILARVLGAAHVAGGVAHVSAAIEAPGVIRHHNPLARLTFGELDGRPSPRTGALLEACRRAGIDAGLSDDIRRDIWEKFVFLVAFSGVTTLARLAVGPILGDPDGRAFFRALMAETVDVGRAAGVGLEAGAVDRLMAFAGGLDPAMKSSMLMDLERGSRLELDWLSGAVVRMGGRLGVAVPANAVVYAALKPHAGPAARPGR